MSAHDRWPHRLARGWTDISAEQDMSRLIRPVRHDGAPYGWLEAHRDGRGKWCTAVLARADVDSSGRPAWRVLSEDPLTLDPSVKCTACGNHGWIRNGRWEPA
jgi:hypothetical protein